MPNTHGQAHDHEGTIEDLTSRIRTESALFAARGATQAGALPRGFLVLTGPSCDVQSVAKVRRASDAIAAAVTAGHVFDLLRMDLQMSVVDGLSASALLRRTHAQANRP